MISQKAQCIWRACGVPSGKQWHKRVFVLPCGSYIISRLQFQGWLLKALMVPDPCGTLDPPLNLSDFYLSHRGHCWLHHNLILVQFPLPVFCQSLQPRCFGSGAEGSFSPASWQVNARQWPRCCCTMAHPAYPPDLSFSSRNSFLLISTSVLLLWEGTTFTWEALCWFPPPQLVMLWDEAVTEKNTDEENPPAPHWGHLHLAKKKFPHVNAAKPNA